MKLLISELPVGSLTLKNRLVMPPMATPKNENNGLATDEVCKYYAEKSQGGFLGLVITEHCYVSIEGKAHNGQLSLADDSTVAGLAQLTQSIHKNGTPVFAQLNHAGGRTQKEITGTRAVPQCRCSSAFKGRHTNCPGDDGAGYPKSSDGFCTGGP